MIERFSSCKIADWQQIDEEEFRILIKEKSFSRAFSLLRIVVPTLTLGVNYVFTFYLPL